MYMNEMVTEYEYSHEIIILHLLQVCGLFINNSNHWYIYVFV